jgi:hypothetical protein
MLNLFTYVSTDPNQLVTIQDFSEADLWLIIAGKLCDTVVFAWGNFEVAKDRAKQVSAMFPNARALHINKNGSPKHPLYCKDDSLLILFNQKVTDGK